MTPISPGLFAVTAWHLVAAVPAMPPEVLHREN
jgi:hypothetical protein